MEKEIKEIVKELELCDETAEVELVEALESVTKSNTFLALDAEIIFKVLKKESVNVFTSTLANCVDNCAISRKEKILNAFQHAMKLVSPENNIEIKPQIINAKTIISIIRGTNDLKLSVVEEAISLLKTATNAKDIFVGADCSLEKGVRIVLITSSDEIDGQVNNEKLAA
ncbi:MAG: hypothetical protein FWE22_04290 [Firmicutes bacterium]|nr:hypothetical protein [Bacillota bacterium]